MSPAPVSLGLVLTSTLTPHIAEIHRYHQIAQESLVAGSDSFDAVVRLTSPGWDGRSWPPRRPQLYILIPGAAPMSPRAHDVAACRR